VSTYLERDSGDSLQRCTFHIARGTARSSTSARRSRFDLLGEGTCSTFWERKPGAHLLYEQKKRYLLLERCVDVVINFLVKNL
jgi:hypothetical protein